MRNLKTNWAVYWAVWRAESGDVYLAVNGTVDVTVHGAVDGNVYWTVWKAVTGDVSGAVHGAVNKYPPHTGLQDFLLEVTPWS